MDARGSKRKTEENKSKVNLRSLVNDFTNIDGKYLRGNYHISYSKSDQKDYFEFSDMTLVKILSSPDGSIDLPPIVKERERLPNLNELQWDFTEALDLISKEEHNYYRPSIICFNWYVNKTKQVPAGQHTWETVGSPLKFKTFDNLFEYSKTSFVCSLNKEHGCPYRVFGRKIWSETNRYHHYLFQVKFVIKQLFDDDNVIYGPERKEGDSTSDEYHSDTSADYSEADDYVNPMFKMEQMSPPAPSSSWVEMTKKEEIEKQKLSESSSIPIEDLHIHSPKLKDIEDLVDEFYDYDAYDRMPVSKKSDSVLDPIDNVLKNVEKEQYESLPPYFKSKLERYKAFAEVHAKTFSLLNNLSMDYQIDNKSAQDAVVIKLAEIKLLLTVLSSEIEASMRSNLSLASANMLMTEWLNKLCEIVSKNSVEIGNFDTGKLFSQIRDMVEAPLRPDRHF